MKHQLCGFKMGRDHYAISALEVEEVIVPGAVAPLPLSGGFVEGLFNLRGQMVVAINLAKWLGTEAEKKSGMGIIVNYRDNLYSLRVDEVVDIFEVDTGQFEQISVLTKRNLRAWTHGIYKLADKLVVHLDLGKMFGSAKEGDTR